MEKQINKSKICKNKFAFNEKFLIEETRRNLKGRIQKGTKDINCPIND